VQNLLLNLVVGKLKDKLEMYIEIKEFVNRIIQILRLRRTSYESKRNVGLLY
jgi:hypothetical protein